MPERRKHSAASTSSPAPLAEVAEVFREFRRSEARISSIPRLYAVDESGRAHTLYFELLRPQVGESTRVRAAIRDIAACGFGALVSKRLQVGEEVRLRALDVVTDDVLHELDYVVRSVRRNRGPEEGMEYIAGMQLMPGSGAVLFQCFLQSIFIRHLMDTQGPGEVHEKLNRLFPGFRPEPRKTAGQPAAKGNVQISLNVGSIRRPAAPVSGGGRDPDEAEAESGLIMVAGKPGQTCRAAEALNGLCFSEFEKPALPLETCNHKLQCTCRLSDFSERRGDAPRRGEQDRRHVAGAPADPGRRLGIDRRGSSWS